jgi:hypothetical protein
VQIIAAKRMQRVTLRRKTKFLLFIRSYRCVGFAVTKFKMESPQQQVEIIVWCAEIKSFAKVQDAIGICT